MFRYFVKINDTVLEVDRSTYSEYAKTKGMLIDEGLFTEHVRHRIDIFSRSQSTTILARYKVVKNEPRLVKMSRPYTHLVIELQKFAEEILNLK